MNWQPIETAPKDGKRVILCYPNGRRTIGAYEVVQSVRNGKVAYEYATWGDGIGLFLADAPGPKWWMPLEDAPKEDA